MTRSALRSPFVQLAIGHALIWLGLAILALCPRDVPTRVATFNVENFRGADARANLVFDEIEQLAAPVVAVQEVRSPEAFGALARERLGRHWRFVHADAGHDQRVGVLYDSAQVTLIGTPETVESVLIGARAKAALLVRVSIEERARPLRLLVVHLTSGRSADGIRAEQLRALEPVLSDAIASGDEVLLLGDFNAVTRGDDEAIAALARRFELEWATRSVECSTYWQREEHCEASTLDHVLTSIAVDAPRVHGGCERDGCGPMARCPAYREQVSDHCPISVELP